MKKVTLVITPELHAQLGLTDSADEAAVGAAIKALCNKAAKVTALQAKADKADELTAENVELKNKVQTIEAKAADAKLEAMLDTAVKEGRITNAVKVQFAIDYKGKTDSLKVILDAMPKQKLITERLEEAAKGTEEGRKEFEAKSWDEMDKAGTLLECRQKYPDVFSAKYEAKFKKPWVG